MTKELNNSFRSACRQLLSAETELNRPMDDVVTLSACQSVRDAMNQMMHIYLSAYETSAAGKSIGELLDTCSKVNPVFSGVDITNIECKGISHAHCDGKYCLTIENVACCLNAANKLKDIICYELNMTE